jgi:hypothetical protein
MTPADIRHARKIIEAAVPGVQFAETDYGFGLSAIKPDLSAEIVVFQPARPEKDQVEIETPITGVIRFLRS